MKVVTKSIIRRPSSEHKVITKVHELLMAVYSTVTFVIGDDEGESFIITTGIADVDPNPVESLIKEMKSYAAGAYDAIRSATNSIRGMESYCEKCHLHAELNDAWIGEGNSSRITFRRWVKEMAENDRGTLQDAAKRYLKLA